MGRKISFVNSTNELNSHLRATQQVGPYEDQNRRCDEHRCAILVRKGGPIGLAQASRSAMSSDLDAVFDHRMMCVGASFLMDLND